MSADNAERGVLTKLTQLKENVSRLTNEGHRSPPSWIAMYRDRQRQRGERGPPQSRFDKSSNSDEVKENLNRITNGVNINCLTTDRGNSQPWKTPYEERQRRVGESRPRSRFDASSSSDDDFRSFYPSKPKRSGRRTRERRSESTVVPGSSGEEPSLNRACLVSSENVRGELRQTGEVTGLGFRRPQQTGEAASLGFESRMNLEENLTAVADQLLADLLVSADADPTPPCQDKKTLTNPAPPPHHDKKALDAGRGPSLPHSDSMACLADIDSSLSDSDSSDFEFNEVIFDAARRWDREQKDALPPVWNAENWQSGEGKRDTMAPVWNEDNWLCREECCRQRDALPAPEWNVDKWSNSERYKFSCSSPSSSSSSSHARFSSIERELQTAYCTMNGSANDMTAACCNTSTG
jgi:hypothetical protein